MKVRSLRVRLMLTFMVIVMAALVAFAVFASQVAKGGLQSYVSNEQANDQKIQILRLLPRFMKKRCSLAVL
jgi:hypothetical protein